MVSTGAAGAQTQRPLEHHLLHPQILRLPGSGSTRYLQDQDLRPTSINCSDPSLNVSKQTKKQTMTFLVVQTVHTGADFEFDMA